MGQATWVAGRSGDWAVAADWTLGTPPLATDDVQLIGPGGGAYQVVSGSGASAQLTLLVDTPPAGAFSAGAVVVGGAAASGALALATATTLSATSATSLHGPL